MQKRNINAQMFDVRPAGNAGVSNCNQDDFYDISDIYASETTKIKASTYILGTPVDSDAVPIFHDSNFDIEKFEKHIDESENEIVLDKNLDCEKDFIQKQILEEAQKQKAYQQKIAEERRLAFEARQREIEEEKERKQQEKLLALEIQRREIQKQKELLEKLRQQNLAREMAISEEKQRLQAEKEEVIRREALEKKQALQEIAQNYRQQRLSYEERVLAERQKRQAEYEAWIKESEKAEKKKLRKKESNKIWWFADERRKSRKSQTDSGFSWKTIFTPQEMALQFDFRSNIAAFTLVAILISFGLGGVSFASKGFILKDKMLGVSQDGYNNLTGAVSDMAHQDFESSQTKFSKAVDSFAQGSSELEEMGSVLITVTRFLPYASKLSSGKNAMDAGKHFSAAGQALNEVVKSSSVLKDKNLSSETSLLEVLKVAEKNIIIAKEELALAKKNMDLIAIDDLPEDKQEKFLLLKQKLPEIIEGIDFFLNNNHILYDLLGGNGPRKYLFLFQNNTEMRATGGFIGSYGLLDISNGHVKKFFIDGIFNPDGQLKDRIVPPAPIQKISANWSLHDSNWFADFPQTAKKAIYFYEKTGGPTTDGVITLTPTVLQKLLKITGPIEMSEYDVTLDSENFVQMTQYEVEVDYDKEENKPKKILSDLAPLVMEKLLSNKDVDSVAKTAQAIIEGLEEKHILLYSQNSDLQKIISEQGWSGEIISANKDYFSVINTNINGYKTDAVIDEKISHRAEIQEDGSIVDTLTITRKHNGGSYQHEWLNKVNADYMRVYVPEGSRLLEVTGQTRETVSAPVDYDSLGFRRDDDVQREENSISIDENSGTRIYNEYGKTVFANWVYVSPGETVTVEYKYELPFGMFKVSVGSGEQIDSYSLIAQKQAGSIGSDFESKVSFPTSYALKWNLPQDMEIREGSISVNQKLSSNRFTGLVFVKED